jgi:endogenous inhibitor of DNA gyrase (YacG/DUF329 family)
MTIPTWGREPEPSTTIRSEPVRREEVLIGYGWQIMTMPEHTYRYTKEWISAGSTNWEWWRGHAEHVEELWRSLLDELSVEREAEIPRLVERYAHIGRVMAAHGLGGGSGYEPPPFSPLPRFTGDIFEYSCQQCGRIFLTKRRSKHAAIRICSDVCRRAYNATVKRAWYQNYEFKDRLIERANAARARRNAERRKGRICQACGAPVEAERSSKKFCSDRCRVAAHRKRKREA